MGKIGQKIVKNCQIWSKNGQNWSKNDQKLSIFGPKMDFFSKLVTNGSRASKRVIF